MRVFLLAFVATLAAGVATGAAFVGLLAWEDRQRARAARIARQCERAGGAS